MATPLQSLHSLRAEIIKKADIFKRADILKKGFIPNFLIKKGLSFNV
jgi:hypothetical protein